MKTFFSNKDINSNKLILRDKDILILDERALASLMNKHFVNNSWWESFSHLNEQTFCKYADLDLNRNSEVPSDIRTSVDDILKRFNCYQSILKIQKAFNMLNKLSFHEISEDEV